MTTTLIHRKLKRFGILLFLFGLVTGLVMANFKNPRMGLAAHLEGIMNGLFLVVVGLIWADLKLTGLTQKITFVTLLYGTYVNWLTTMLAANFGTSRMTPLSGKGFNGTIFHEQIVTAGFISVGLTMLFSLTVLVYGLRDRVS